ncbi:MAG: N-acetylmuramoyl-L-alanine amidase family protein [Chthoniobacterales bacterium]
MVLFPLLKKSAFIRGVALLLLLALFPGCALLKFSDSDLKNFHTVIIDPGHGGYDSGARAVHGASEKNLALDTAQRLKPLLEKKGYRVILTRTTDIFIPLGMRTAISNAHPNAIFISIHFNCSPRRTARGIETYYCYNRPSERLASSIFDEVSSFYGRRYNRGVKPAFFFVLSHNHHPATLLELGFVSNRNENELIQNSNMRQELAERIATAIQRVKGHSSP